MGRKAKTGEVNKSAAIRELLTANPTIAAAEAVAALKEKGIEIRQELFYLVKGKALGGKRRRRKRAVSPAATPTAKPSSGNAVAVILRVKEVAREVGGVATLRALIDALSE